MIPKIWTKFLNTSLSRSALSDLFQKLQLNKNFILLDLALLVAALLMINTPAKVLFFHIIFILLTFGAFYWKFHAFAIRAIVWITITAFVITLTVLAGETQVEEILEIPLLTSILILVFSIAQQRSDAEQALRQSEERYHTLSDNLFQDSRDAIFVTNPEGKIVNTNQALLALFGHPNQEEIIGLDYQKKYLQATDHNDVRQQLKKKGFAKNIEITLNKKDGNEVYCLLTLSIWRANDGSIQGYQGIIHDITDRKQAEQEREQLLITEHEHRLLAETLGDVFLALTSQTNYEAVLDEILRQTQRIVSFDAANIMMLSKGHLKIAHHRGYEKSDGQEIMSNLKQALTDFPLDVAVIQSQQPIVVQDTNQNPHWVATDVSTWVRSFIAVPLCLQERTLGLLRLDSNEPEKFSKKDLKQLYPLANAAAIALDNARLYDEARQELAQQAFQTESEIIQLNQKMLTLQYASATIASSRRLAHILHNVPKDMANLLSVPSCCIFE